MENDMWEISESLLSKAKLAAEKMKQNGDLISTIPFGEEDGTMFVSSDPDLIKGTDEFEVDGKKFYVGTKK